MRTKAKVSQIGLDVHRKFSIASARDAGSQRIVWRERLQHMDREALRSSLSRWPQGTPVILEGTFGWGWMSDELAAAKLQPHLASSRKVAGWREARGLAKSNRLDADLLSELWDQKPTLQGGVLRRWWEVWLAPPEVRDQRELLRHRMSLVRMQTGLKNRIHALLHRHGIVNEFSDLFGVAGRRMLSRLVDDGQKLRETARRVLKDQLILLDALRRLIARATRQFRLMVLRCEPAQRLMSLPGVSTVLAYTIVAEVGRIERFRTARHLARYSLLAPPPATRKADDPDGSGPSVPYGAVAALGSLPSVALSSATAGACYRVVRGGVNRGAGGAKAINPTVCGLQEMLEEPGSLTKKKSGEIFSAREIFLLIERGLSWIGWASPAPLGEGGRCPPCVSSRLDPPAGFSGR